MIVTGAVIYAFYRRLVVKPKRLTISAEGFLILGLILLIMITDVIFEAAFFELNHSSASLWSPLAYVTTKVVFGNCLVSTVMAWHNFAYWCHIFSILVLHTDLPHLNNIYFLVVKKQEGLFYKEPI